MMGKRVLWLPQDFQVWPEGWRGLNLRFNGLCYEYVPAPDSGPLPAEFAFPGPHEYSTGRFRDEYSRDLCRRFAATANRRGILHFSRENATAALRDFDLALGYFPDYPGAVENKGIVFYYENERDSSRLYLEKFLELAPLSPERGKVMSFLRNLRG
jgi:tetratricopeptide (TPR) repeat protein